MCLGLTSGLNKVVPINGIFFQQIKNKIVFENPKKNNKCSSKSPGFEGKILTVTRPK